MSSTRARWAGIAAITAVCAVAGGGVAVADEATGSISGLVWNDRDADGAVGEGDGVLWDAYVEVHRPNGDWVTWQRASYDGTYTISGLPEGDYLVTGGKYGFASTTRSVQRVVVTSEGVSGVDFGARGGQITGRIWHDVNEDGVRQDDEPGLVDALTYVASLHSQESWRQEADGTYVVYDLEAGSHVFSTPSRSTLARSPKGAGDDPERDSDFERTGVSETVEFRVVGDQVLPVGGPVVLDVGYYVGVTHGALTFTADRDTTDLEVGDTVVLTATAAYTGNAIDTYGVSIDLPQGLTEVSVTQDGWLRETYGGDPHIFLRRSWDALEPVTSTFTITARVTAPITSGLVTGKLNNSSYLADWDLIRASLPVSATS
ncbi:MULTISPECIES: SdrD B-like domain-containing protein [Actinosynnema]|uniref:SdrD B-like domain-containing protein n=1 Tax=Actinosynnema TaxID=40566 RepID=UPI0020A295F1|nr:SdrD B-like domain-containing protein [Actinosynnema pretiosum]MCP2097595.1 hypothetical protein [Actinosynnema pretiosum]